MPTKSKASLKTTTMALADCQALIAKAQKALIAGKSDRAKEALERVSTEIVLVHRAV